VVLRARENLDPKASVTAGYGVRSNADYLLYHGFTMPREWSDLTLCTQYAMIELPLPPDMPSWKSRFLVHPYRFAVPACPNRKYTPHVVVGAARFLTATEQDVVDFEERVMQDPSLMEGAAIPKDDKFLHHSAKEALTAVCDTKVQPPLCRAPLSVESERRAWDLIKKQTLARVALHFTPIEEDSRILEEDDTKNTLSVNQRHAVIVRREEKLALRNWCTVSVRLASFLSTAEGAEEVNVTRLPDSEVLENEEPRVRPRYWTQLLHKITEADYPAECRPR